MDENRAWPWIASFYLAWRVYAHDLSTCVVCLPLLARQVMVIMVSVRKHCFSGASFTAKNPATAATPPNGVWKLLSVAAVCFHGYFVYRNFLTWPTADLFVHLGWVYAAYAELIFTRFSSEKEVCLQRVQQRSALALVCHSFFFFILSTIEDTSVLQPALIKLGGMIPFLIMSSAYAYVGGLRNTSMVKGYFVIVLAYFAEAGASICSSMLCSLLFLGASGALSCLWFQQYGLAMFLLSRQNGLAIAAKGIPLGSATAMTLQKTWLLSFMCWVIGAVGQFLHIVGLFSTNSLLRFLCTVEFLHITSVSHIITKRKDVLRKADLQAEFPNCLEEKQKSADGLTLVVQLQELQEGSTIVVCNSAISGMELTRITLSDRKTQTLENFRMHVCNQLSVNPSSLRLLSPSGDIFEDRCALLPISVLLAPAQMDQGSNATGSAKIEMKTSYTRAGGA